MQVASATACTPGSLNANAVHALWPDASTDEFGIGLTTLWRWKAAHDARFARTLGCSTRNASCSPTPSAMAAYNAKSTLARMLRPHYSRADDEARAAASATAPT